MKTNSDQVPTHTCNIDVSIFPNCSIVPLHLSLILSKNPPEQIFERIRRRGNVGQWGSTKLGENVQTRGTEKS